jgi:hypothetical protein
MWSPKVKSRDVGIAWLKSTEQTLGSTGENYKDVRKTCQEPNRGEMKKFLSRQNKILVTQIIISIRNLQWG